MDAESQHEHTHNQDPGGRSSIGSRLRFAFMLSATILVAELIAGFLANSLALISDAGHVFTDVLALGLSYYGIRQAQRPATSKMTFGYHRLGVLIAAINALTIVVISGVIFFEGYRRLQEPPEVQSVLMFSIAAIGLIANLVVVERLHHHQKRSINVRSAFLHAWGDALASVGVIIGGIIITFTDWFWIDPAVSIFIGAIIAFAAWGIVRETIDIFLEASPRFINSADLAKSLCSLEGVNGVHDLHTWSITPQIHALSCHIVVDDRLVSEGAHILDRVNAMLRDKFSIEHSTVQVETVPCGDNTLHCVLISEDDAGGHDHHHH